MAPWIGSPGNQTFQRTDGTRTGQQVWQQADAAGVDIVAPDHDLHDQDIANGLQQVLKKDGGNSASANIPMGGFRFTNVGSASARDSSVNTSDVQDGRLTFATTSGSRNAINLTNAIAITSYIKGQTFRFIPTDNNTGAVTVAVDGLAAKAVKVNGTDLTAGQILSGSVITITFDGTDFEMNVGTTPAAVGVGSVMAYPLPTVPTGWLECDGSAVSRTSYAALFSVLGTSYGTGDGSTTFNLPNYKDFFLRGFDAAGTDAGSRTNRGDGATGANVGTKQADQIRSHVHTGQTASAGNHTHLVQIDKSGATQGSSGRLRGDGGASTGPNGYTTDPGGDHSHPFTTDGTGGTETRPKNITVKWIILALPSAAAAIMNMVGDPGWSPILAVASSGAKKSFRITDWVGGEGTKPATGGYIGPTGIVANIADAVDLAGVDGTNGWSPILSLIVDGERRVLQISDWTGGTGSEPASGSYIGATGLVVDIADAIDVRGAVGRGFDPDAIGLFAQRSAHDGEAAGYSYLAIDGNGAGITTACLFFKKSATSGDWSDATPLGGMTGPTSATDGNITVFNGTGGNAVKDSGIKSNLVTRSLNGNKLDPYTGQVATRCRISTSFYNGNKQMMATSRHVCRDDVSSLQLVFANWYVDNNGVEQAPGASATITASIEFPIGVLTQVKFSASASGTIADGSNLVSDAVSVKIPKGAIFWIRSYYTNTAGVIFHTLRDNFGGEASNTGPSGITDQTMSGSVVSSVPTATGSYCPVAIIGTTTVPSVILIGDSRVEHGTDIMNAAGYIGNLERSIAPLCATINCGKGGEGPGTVKTNMTRRAALGNSYCKYAIIQEGINDINLLSIAGATVAASIATMVGQFTIPTYTATIEPVSTSSDNWATVANQTTMANEAQRVILNNAIRSGISGAAGYFEIADFFEPSRNSGKWKADGTAYGYTGNGGHASRKGECYLEDSGIVDPRIFFPNPAQIRLPATVEQVVRGDASDRQVSGQIAGCKPLFKVHKNGTDQTGITTGVSTQLAWSYVVLDQGGYFDLTNSAYVPPAGFYRLVASVTFSVGIVDQNAYDVLILKNGATVGFARSASSGTNGFSVMAECLVQTNGSDVFTVNVIGRGAGDKTVAGLATSTMFFGNAL